MSMAVKYAMKKRMAKGGEADDSVTSPVQVSGTNMGCRGPECMGCSSPKCMAHGGKVDHSKGVNKPYGVDKESGMSKAGEAVRYAKKDPEFARDNKDYAMHEHQQARKELSGMKKPHLYAEGGDVMDDDDLVMHIMKKRYSKGGEVANDSDPIVDGMDNEFDDLVKDDGLEMHETGANSGDELGDEQVEEDDEDTVSKIMKSRKKKDRMPRPA